MSEQPDYRFCVLCERMIDLAECQTFRTRSGNWARTTAIKNGIPHILLSKSATKKITEAGAKRPTPSLPEEL